MSETGTSVELSDVQGRGCPVRTMLDHVTSRWAVLIFKALSERPYRFNELRRRVGGVSEKMLAQTLRTLQQDGLVQRAMSSATRPAVVYELTPTGLVAARHVDVLVTWAEEHAELLSTHVGETADGAGDDHV